jgi:exonuclease SbcD
VTRLVVFGDTHLQSTNSRNADRLRAWDQVIAEGRALEQLGAWIHVGDVFHSRSTPDDRVQVAERLQAMAELAPVVVLYGNHEAPLDLHVFGKIKAAHPIVVVDRPDCLTVALATGNVATLFCLPYPSKAGLASLGVTPAAVQDVAADALDLIFMQAAADLEAARTRGDLTLMIGHATIGGAISSAGQPMGVHGEITVNAGHLARLDGIPQLFGHIHKPQQIHEALYVGSACRLDFAETEEKRYVVVEFDTLGDLTPKSWGSSWRILSYPIACPPRYHVDGVLTRDAFTWSVKRGPNGDVEPTPASWAGCEVRVRYTFAQSEKSALPTELVRAPFAEAARLEVEPIAVPDRALRAPAVAAARTLADKVAAVCQVEALAPSVAAKLARLEHAEAATVLAEVQAGLDAPAPTELVGV